MKLIQGLQGQVILISKSKFFQQFLSNVATMTAKQVSQCFIMLVLFSLLAVSSFSLPLNRKSLNLIEEVQPQRTVFWSYHSCNVVIVSHAYCLLTHQKVSNVQSLS